MPKQCPRLEKCPLFQHFVEIKDSCINLYCKGEFEACKRKQKADRGEEVPKAMLPNGDMLD